MTSCRAQNNQVSGTLCSTATDIAGPPKRLRHFLPSDFAFVGAPILLQLVMLQYGRSGHGVALNITVRSYNLGLTAERSATTR